MSECRRGSSPESFGAKHGVEAHEELVHAGAERLAAWSVAVLTGTMTILMVELLAVAVYYTRKACFLPVGVRLYEDLRALTGGQALETSGAALSPEAKAQIPTAELGA